MEQDEGLLPIAPHTAAFMTVGVVSIPGDDPNLGLDCIDCVRVRHRNDHNLVMQR